MKKPITLMLAMAMALSLAACSDEADAPSENTAPQADQQTESQPEEKQVVLNDVAFGDITISVPSEFDAVQETQGVYVAAGPDSSLTVTPATEIELMPEEWDESLAADMLEPYYGSVYTDLALLSFQDNMEINGTSAIYMSFQGKNAQGADRIAHIIRLYDLDNSAQYIVTLVHSDGNELFTPEVSEAVLNSITLGA
jgi:hypothetical protein